MQRSVLVNKNIMKVEDHICLRCKHLGKLTDKQIKANEEFGIIIFSTALDYCLAFPQGIPDNLLSHNKIIKGQYGDYLFSRLKGKAHIPEG